MIYLDTNVFIYAYADSTGRAKAALALMAKIEKGLQAATCALTIDEVLWTLIKQKLTDDPFEIIRNIYAMPNLTILDVSGNAPLESLRYIENADLHPRDAIHVAVMKQHSIRTIVSSDKDFDRVESITRIPVPA